MTVETGSVNAMPIVKVDAYQCARCGHIWLPRDPAKRPVSCAKCKNAYWDIPRPAEKPKAKSKRR